MFSREAPPRAAPTFGWGSGRSFDWSQADPLRISKRGNRHVRRLTIHGARSRVLDIPCLRHRSWHPAPTSWACRSPMTCSFDWGGTCDPVVAKPPKRRKRLE